MAETNKITRNQLLQLAEQLAEKKLQAKLKEYGVSQQRKPVLHSDDEYRESSEDKIARLEDKLSRMANMIERTASSNENTNRQQNNQPNADSSVYNEMMSNRQRVAGGGGGGGGNQQNQNKQLDPQKKESFKQFQGYVDRFVLDKTAAEDEAQEDWKIEEDYRRSEAGLPSLDEERAEQISNNPLLLECFMGVNKTDVFMDERKVRANLQSIGGNYARGVSEEETSILNNKFYQTLNESPRLFQDLGTHNFEFNAKLQAKNNESRERWGNSLPFAVEAQNHKQAEQQLRRILTEQKSPAPQRQAPAQPSRKTVESVPQKQQSSRNTIKDSDLF